MNNDETYTPCTKCGRPMAYCKGQCCGKTKGCQCKEYGPKVCGAIRPIEPSCPYQAVIPSLTVESVSNLKDLADCFVHVSDINTTFYIDDKHRMMTTWAGPVEYNNYDLAANSLGLRSQFLIDFANERGAYYDKTGNYKVFNFSDSGGLDIDMWKAVHPLFVNDGTMVIGENPIRYIKLPDDAISEWGMTSSDFGLHQGMRCAVAVNGSYQSSTNNDEMGIAIHTAGTSYSLKPVYRQYKYLSDIPGANVAQPLLYSDIPYTVNADTILELVYVKNNYYDGWIVTNIEGSDTATYTITADNLRADSSFASRNWELDSTAGVTAMSSSSVTVTKDGAAVSASDLASSGNSLLKSVFVFNLPASYPDPNVQDSVIQKPVQVSAKPTSITIDDSGLVISGVYSLDGSSLEGLPGSLVIPPLRFSLAASTEGGQTVLTFHAETVSTLL